MANKSRSPRSGRKRIWSVLFVLVATALILTLRLVETIGPERGPLDRFVVEKIIDGDTAELRGGDKLRLLALDTPERGEAFHDEAADLFRQLAKGQVADIRYANRRRDKYGRLLGYLYIDTLFVNQAIIDSGLGYVYLFSDNELGSPEVAAMLKAQRRAIDAKRGLWSVPRESEERYLARPGSFRLHRPSCRSIKVDRGEFIQFATRAEGIATGLSPCRNCKP